MIKIFILLLALSFSGTALDTPDLSDFVPSPRHTDRHRPDLLPDGARCSLAPLRTDHPVGYRHLYDVDRPEIDIPALFLA